MPDVSAYSFGRFKIDLRSSCLRDDNDAVPLRPKSFDVLLYLVRNHGRVVSKDELMDSVWANIAVTENSLVQCIKEIRQALQDEQQQTVQTVAKRGYLFAPAVTEHKDGAIPFETPARAAAAGVKASPSSPGPAWRVYTAGATAILALAAGLWFWTARPTDKAHPASPPAAADIASPNRLSIAVLPFATGPGTPGGDYFSTGIADDISMALGRFAELTVVTPNVVSRVQTSGSGGQNIGQALKVRYLVEGSLRRAGERVRATVTLNEVASGALLWSESYDAPDRTILALEDDIAIRIAGALAVKLTNLEQKRAASQEPGSMEAYDLVLRGRDLLARLNRTAHSEARILFERAIELDPHHAPAYVGLGRTDLGAVALGWTANAQEALKRAELHARKAISIDEFSPAAHVLLGRTYTRMGDYDRGVETLKRAVALNPSNPDSHAGLGDALLWNGELREAMASLETAFAIDPRLSAEDLFDLGTAYFLEGRVADSLRVFARATTRNEGNPYIYAMLAALYAESGRTQEAQAAAVEVRKLNPFFDAQNFGSLFKQPQHRQKMADAMKKAGF